MPISLDHIGTVSEPRRVTVEEGFLKFFAKVTGETRPQYCDPDAAKAMGLPGLLAPPTYIFSLHMSAPARRGDLFDQAGGMGIDPRTVLHAEQSFEPLAPIYAGERLVLTTTTKDVVSKRGGALVFVTQETAVADETGARRARMTTTVAVRNG